MHRLYRRILPALLIVVLATGCWSNPVVPESSASSASGVESPVEEPAAPESPVPAVGEQLHGFTVTAVSEEKMLGVPAITFTHNQSGGTVQYIAAKDRNRSFALTFRTPAVNDKGLPHIFEHITISGSEKFPSPTVYFAVKNQTFNTAMGAVTDDTWTAFHMDSLSEEQLLTMSDYFLDGVFHPLVYTEERLLRREGWRYELSDSDVPLTLTGTVYNEMRGHDNILNAARDNLLETLYPGSIIANNCGGDPAHIPELEWQEVLDFHGAYYHPANALVLLYGEMDYGKFLEKIGGYFEEFEQKEIEVDDGVIPPLTETQEATFRYPVEKDSPAENASVISYGIVPKGLSELDTLGLSILSSMFTHESSPMMAEVRKVFPEASFTAEVKDSIAQPYISFQAEGLGEGDRANFRALIDGALETMAAGIDAGVVDAALSARQFQGYFMADSSMVGYRYVRNMTADWSRTGRTDYFNRFYDGLEEIAGKVHSGYFEGLITKYLADNPHSAVIATVPVPGGAEEKAEAMAAELAGIKAAMTDGEVAELVASTAELAAWSSQDPPREMVEQLQAVQVQDLPEEVRHYETTDKVVDGVRMLTSESTLPKVGFTYLYFDTGSIPVEDLHYYKLYSQLAGTLATKSHDKETLASLTGRYLNGFALEATVVRQPDGSHRPALAVMWRSLNEDYARTVELAREVLFATDLGEIEGIRAAVSDAKNAMRNSYSFNLDSSIMARAAATGNEGLAYSDYLGGLDYYRFLLEAEKLLDSDPAAFTARLADVQKRLATRQDAVAMFAGDRSAIAEFEEAIGAMYDGLSAEAGARVDYAAIPRPAGGEAIVSDVAVQFNLLHAPLEQLGIEESGKLDVLGNILYESYLTPRIRHTIGAYDTIHSFGENGLTLVSYRDPGIAETYEAFDGMGDFFRSLDLTQADLDRYILSAYGSASMPRGDLTGGLMGLLEAVSGKTDLVREERLRQMKSLTVDEVHAFGEVMDRLSSGGVRMTGGSAAVIEQNRELFDTVIYFNQIA